MTDFNKLAADIFADNKAAGWWDDMDRCPYTTLQLVSTEIAEATEGERKNLMDDKLPHRKMGEVELADALIRVLDFGGRYGFKYEGVPVSLRSEQSPGYYHYWLNYHLFEFGAGSVGGQVRVDDVSNRSYSRLIDLLLHVSDRLNYDIMAALEDKREYNKTRKDHTREARAQEHGKAF